MSPEKRFSEIGAEIDGAIAGNLFGKPCYKINGKAFVCLFKEEMVFKLSDTQHKEALSLDGTQLFDPSGKRRPMKEWVQIPFDYQEKWPQFATAAHNYVGKSK